MKDGNVYWEADSDSLLTKVYPVSGELYVGSVTTMRLRFCIIWSCGSKLLTKKLIISKKQIVKQPFGPGDSASSGPERKAMRPDFHHCSCQLQGLAALLVQGLSGCRPEDIIRIQPEFLEQLGLGQALTPSRNNGFLNMFKLMQAKALQLLSG